MSSNKIYQNQPLTLYLDTGQDLVDLSITQFNIEVKKPDGELATWVGSYWNDAENTGNQQLTYSCVKDVDLDQVGMYAVMADIDDGSNGPWPGDTFVFEVHERFK